MGLAKPSIARLNRLVTAERTVLNRRLGQLSARDEAAVRSMEPAHETMNDASIMPRPPVRRFSRQRFWFNALLALVISTIPLLAVTTGTSGNFTYADSGTKISITGYVTAPSGAMNIPATINGKPVTTIGDSAFQSCSKLTSVTIPSSVTSIGRYVFYSCSKLTSVTLSSNLTNINDLSFAFCGALTGISIPSSVTSIGDSAFHSCYGLTSMTIPSSVTFIWPVAFGNCTSLTALNVHSSNPSYSSVNGVLFNKLKTILIEYPAGKSGPYVIPSSVKSFGFGAFDGSVHLTSVTIPTSVTALANNLFFKCSGLTSVTIPSSVTSMGTRVFHGCSSLESVAIPSSITSIGSNVFYDCPSLRSLTIPSSVTSISLDSFMNSSTFTGFLVDAANPAFSSVDGVLFNKAQTTLVYHPGGQSGDYIIPYSVTHLGDFAFGGNTSLASVSIPPSVTSIGYCAFSNCTGLTSVMIPASVSSIGSRAFASCSGMTSISIPSSVTSIGSYAFISCSQLTSAIFRGNAPNMGTQVFYAVASGFTVKYYSESTGFTSPNWTDSAGDTYPAVDLGNSPAANWLTSNGFPSTTDLSSAPNHDGVPLLLAYALNLDPTTNESGNLPKPISMGNRLSLSYYAGNSDVTYIVQTSTDLQTWVPTGVTLSAPDANHIVTASVPETDGARFLRLVVSR